jgi:hypothetical protein
MAAQSQQRQRGGWYKQWTAVWLVRFDSSWQMYSGSWQA